MIVGRITGKVTTTEFSFIVDGNPQKFDYVQVYHPDYEYVLCQIVEIERQQGSTIAKCVVFGYLDQEGTVRQIRTPFEPGTEVLKAEDSFITSVIQLDNGKNGAYIGFLEGKRIPVYVDLNTLLTKHLAVLAKSGGGKSYTVGVLLEEIMSKGVPLLIIDPHGEYSSMKHPTDETEKLQEFGIEPGGFGDIIQEFGDPDIVDGASPLRLPEHLSAQELLHLLPGKLSPNQQNVLYSALKNMDEVTLPKLLNQLEAEESNAKFSVINIVDYLYKQGIFSLSPTPYHELVQSGRCSIVNLKGTDPQLQEIMVAKLLGDLFELRKKDKVPPFFCIIEEAHTFCPERSFGETKVSKVLRTIASEGRKFGLGLGVISQRPARVDKSVLSQCSTQVILKVTNPNDLKAISSSVEGLTSESEREVMNLPIGTALVTGLVDAPLFTTIRPRKSKHGGDAVEILKENEDTHDFMQQMEQYNEKEMLPVVQPKMSLKDIYLMEGDSIHQVTTYLSPAALFVCRSGETEFSLLADLYKGGIVYDDRIYYIPQLDVLSRAELMTLKVLFKQKTGTADSLRESGVKHVEEALTRLKQLGYVQERDDHYSINYEYVFTHLKHRSSHRKVEHIQVSFDHKREKTMQEEELQALLQRYVSVEDKHPCWLIDYVIEYQDDTSSD